MRRLGAVGHYPAFKMHFSRLEGAGRRGWELRCWNTALTPTKASSPALPPCSPTLSASASPSGKRRDRNNCHGLSLPFCGAEGTSVRGKQPLAPFPPAATALPGTTTATGSGELLSVNELKPHCLHEWWVSEKQGKGEILHCKKTSKEMKINPPMISKAVLGLPGIPAQRF